MNHELHYLSFNNVIYTPYSVSDGRKLYSIHLDTVTRNFDTRKYVCHISKVYTVF